MKDNYAISRIQSYKYSDCGGVLKEALRILPNYDNPNCNPELSYLNVVLVETDLQGLTPEKYILKYREDNNIKGRFNTNAVNPKNLTNVMCQALFTASSDYLSQLDRNEQIEYFKSCLEFFNNEFPSVHIVAANIHYDENSPHLHISYFPVVQRVNNKTGELESIFSTTKLMPGKDFFPKYQDRFYKFISDKYDGFTRSHSSRDNMSVKEFKEYCRFNEKYALVCQQLNETKKALYESKKCIGDMYAELSQLRQEKSKFESIPLIGILFEIIKDMENERLERILKQSIKLARQEQKEMEFESKSLDKQIESAKLQQVKPFKPMHKNIQKEL